MTPFLRKNWRNFLLIVLLSLLAGVVGGLFGTGGGILIVFLFSRILGDSEEIDRKDLFAMTVLAVAIMSCASLVSYLRTGAVTADAIAPSLLPAVLGGLIGALLLDKLETKWLNRIFALLILYAGGTLLFR